MFKKGQSGNPRGRIAFTRKELTQRLLSKIEVVDGPLDTQCWKWTGHIVPKKGYGTVAYRRKKALAHRVSYELLIGPIPPGLCVCHRCDNPPCINPQHLFVGTGADNMADAAAKGRMPRGEQHPNSKLTEAQVREIKQGLRNGETVTSLARKFGISKGRISNMRFRSWKHIP